MRALRILFPTLLSLPLIVSAIDNRVIVRFGPSFLGESGHTTFGVGAGNAVVVDDNIHLGFVLDYQRNSWEIETEESHDSVGLSGTGDYTVERPATYNLLFPNAYLQMGYPLGQQFSAFATLGTEYGFLFKSYDKPKIKTTAFTPSEIDKLEELEWDRAKKLGGYFHGFLWKAGLGGSMALGKSSRLVGHVDFHIGRLRNRDGDVLSATGPTLWLGVLLKIL